ncbi:YdcF family protein [Microvirga sp. TS319]|uniref:YdcF family protein n=1 Tax=Microvirga sp. TS319 TaxID=3241165 RepID=UPI00351A6B6C
MESAINTRQRIIDYIAPELELFRCEHALLFGSRHAQAPLVQHTKWLFDQGYFERLIISGGCTQGIARPEADQLAQRLVEAGVPAHVILTECRSRNTGENVMFSREMMGSAVRELLLIGKIYAKRRYAMTVRAQWPEVKRMTCSTINYFGVPRDRWWHEPELKRRVMAETRKIPSYLASGYIREVGIERGHLV